MQLAIFMTQNGGKLSQQRDRAAWQRCPLSGIWPQAASYRSTTRAQLCVIACIMRCLFKRGPIAASA